VLQESTYADDTTTIIANGIAHKTPYVSDNCTLAAGKYLLSEHTNKNFETVKGVLEALAAAIKEPISGSIDTKRLALVVVRTVSRTHEEVSHPA
jgi:hypothetical protein